MTGIFANPKTLLITILVITVLVISVLGGALGNALGFGFLSSSLPAIQLPAEQIFAGDDLIAPVDWLTWNLMNTMLTTWLAMLVLIICALLIRKSLTEIPGRFQSLFEIIMDFFLSLCESVSGSRDKARRFFPLVFTIFIFIIVSNWMGILPGFGTIGRIASPEEIAHHHGVHSYIDPALDYNDEHKADEHHGDEDHSSHLDSVKLHVFQGQGNLAVLSPGSLEEELTFDVYKNGKKNEDGSQEPPGYLSISDENKRAGHLVPFLRSANTDVNMTLAMAIIAMVMVHYWGLSILGVTSHIGKFINFKEGPIGFFVGILEIISELAKVISFTFRLFGNIFAGEVLLMAIGFLLPLIGIMPFLGLELFVGVIQALIFSMLTLVFASMATVSHSVDDH